MATIELNTNPKAFGTILYYSFMEVYIQIIPRDIVPWEDLTEHERANWQNYAKAVLRKAML